MESVVAGIIPSYDSIRNVQDFPFSGVQVRSFYSQIHAPENAKTQLYFAPLKPHVREAIMKQNSMEQINAVLKSFMWMKYPVFRPLNVLPAIHPVFAKMKKYRKDGYVICSELVAGIFSKLGALPPNIDPTEIFPADFVILPEFRDLFSFISLLKVDAPAVHA
jgi:hypothetical protein